MRELSSWAGSPAGEPRTGCVAYVGSNAATAANMYGLDASTGTILWSFASGGEVRSGAAIVGAKVYWGSGYRGGDNNKLYAFKLQAG